MAKSDGYPIQGEFALTAGYALRGLRSGSVAPKPSNLMRSALHDQSAGDRASMPSAISPLGPEHKAGFISISSKCGRYKYKMGLIDLLTKYSCSKLIENEFKSKAFRVDPIEISAIDEKRYQ